MSKIIFVIIKFILNERINKIIINFLFLFLFLLGIIIYKDFGIGWDEISDRSFGNYLSKIIVSFFSLEIAEYYSASNLFIEKYNRYPNIFFEYTSSFFEFFLRKYFNIITTNKEVFELRHFLIFNFFLIGCYYFVKLNKKIYCNFFISLITLLFLITLPRVFGHSFFNSNDLIHMSFTIINVYYGMKFIEKKEPRTILILIIISCININSRISAIFIIGLILCFDYLFLYKKKKNFFVHLFIFTITILLTYITNPYLFKNSIVQNLHLLTVLFKHPNSSEVLYLNTFINSKDLPWHYLIIWILATFPIVTILMSFLSTFFLILYFNKNIIKKNYILIYTNCFFFLPIIFGIIFSSAHLDAERYAMFTYPYIIINIGFLLKFLILNKKFFMIYLSILIIFISINVYNLYSFHPYQMIYFNELFRKNAHLNFDIDYWGVVNRDAIKFILKSSDKELIKIYAISSTPLENSKWILDENDAKRILITDDISKADYILNNFRRYQKVIDNNKYELYYTIQKNNIKILEVYTNK